MKQMLLLVALSLSTLAQANTHVVYIGDSHSVGTFGETINQWLRSRKEIAFTFSASGGTAPLQWLNGIAPLKCWLQDTETSSSAPKGQCLPPGTNSTRSTPKFSSLLRSYDPEKDANETRIAIIAHGTNFGTKGDPKNRITPEMQFNQQVATSVELIRTAANRHYQCVWIGPPTMKKYEGGALEIKFNVVKKALEKAKNKYGIDCQLIDSRLLTTYPDPEKPDGIHYTFPGTPTKARIEEAKLWAQSVVKLLPNLP